MTLRQLWSGWNSFWFGVGSPIPLALFRIALGVLVVAFSVWIFPEADIFFGQHSIVRPETSASLGVSARFSLLSYLPGDDIWIRLMLILLAVCGVCLVLGVFSRLSALIAYLIILSLDARNHFVLHTGHKILYIMLLYLTLSRCGDALSVKRLARIWSPTNPEFGAARDGSIFAQRLIQVQLAIVYWSAFSAKLHGKSWMDGSAIYYATHVNQFQRFPVPYLFDHLWTCRLLTWGTLALEFSLCALIWVKELRYPLLAAGTIFHLGLDWALVLPLFEYVMLAGYICFIDAADLSKLMGSIRRLAGKIIEKPLPSAYDDTCGVARRLAETVRRLDVFGWVQLIEIRELSGEQAIDASAADRRAHVFVLSRRDNKWLSGVPALRSLGLRLPLVLPFCWLFWIPGFNLLLSRLRSLLLSVYRQALSG